MTDIRHPAGCHFIEALRTIGSGPQSEPQAFDGIVLPALEHGGHNPGLGSRRLAVVLNTFSVWPVRGGGQARVFELYSRLARQHDVVLLTLGTEDEPATHVLGPAFHEILIPMAAPQRELSALLQSQFPDTGMGDISAIDGISLTPRFAAVLGELLRKADLLFLEHPYLMNAIPAAWRGRFIYSAHNVEADLKRQMLPQGELADRMVERVAAVEQVCCAAARRIITVCAGDAEALAARYDVARGKIAVVSNGATFTDCHRATAADRAALRRRLGVEGPLAVFLGSLHRPNQEAAREVERLARECPAWTFVLLGAVASVCDPETLPPNVVAAGALPRSLLDSVLAVADLGLNPATSGGGSSLKIYDYCAAGVPMLSTAIGIRGTPFRAGEHCLVAPLDQWKTILDSLAAHGMDACSGLAHSAWKVGKAADWDVLADWFALNAAATTDGSTPSGREIAACAAGPPGHDAVAPASLPALPLVSIIVTAHDYGRYLKAAIASIRAQRYTEIECLVVDDGSTDETARVLAEIHAGDPEIRVLTLRENRGQGAASRTGFTASRGQYIVFMDADDVLAPDFVLTHIYVHLSSRIRPGLSSSDVWQTVDDRIVVGTAEALNDRLRASPAGPGEFRPIDPTPEGPWRYDGPAPAVLDGARHVPSGLTGWCWSPMTANMFRRDALTLIIDCDMFERMTIGADVYLCTGVSVLCGSVLIDRALSSYRIHGGNVGTFQPQLQNLRTVWPRSELSVLAKTLLVEHLTGEMDALRARFWGPEPLLRAIESLRADLPQAEPAAAAPPENAVPESDVPEIAVPEIAVPESVMEACQQPHPTPTPLQTETRWARRSRWRRR
jgi:glycosyltransferase involved in cell wall biosynthesis